LQTSNVIVPERIKVSPSAQQFDHETRGQTDQSFACGTNLNLSEAYAQNHRYIICRRSNVGVGVCVR
jgi:hypothetical protein